MKTIFVPFDTPAYRNINSNHPLISPLVDLPSSNFNYQRVNHSRYTDLSTVLYHATELSKNFDKLFCDRNISIEKTKQLFIISRDIESQLLTPIDCDLNFYHTCPMHLGHSKWIIHIENISQIFIPFIYQGYPPELPLKKTIIYWFVKSMLESEKCRAIFSNLEFTIKQVQQIFDSDIINSKLYHLRAGTYLSPLHHEIIQNRISHRKTREETNILFTNSWHGDPNNFILRGGVDLVAAFLKISDACPNLYLQIRSTIPPVIQVGELGTAITSHPRIKLINQTLAEDEIISLFADSDIFLLDSAALHSVSVLRAMASGSVCIVSDVPGYNEYINDNSTGIILKGKSELVNCKDHDSGWVMDDYSKISFNCNLNKVNELSQTLKFLYDSKDARLIYGENARNFSLSYNNFSYWRNGFEQLLSKSCG